MWLKLLIIAFFLVILADRQWGPRGVAWLLVGLSMQPCRQSRTKQSGDQHRRCRRLHRRPYDVGDPPGRPDGAARGSSPPLRLSGAVSRSSDSFGSGFGGRIGARPISTACGRLMTVYYIWQGRGMLKILPVRYSSPSVTKARELGTGGPQPVPARAVVCPCACRLAA
jgi:hypothetical protein